jgi:putative ABC transport system substrate-binding protein
MNRRGTVLALLALSAAPLASLAQQQGKVWRIGFLASIPSREEFDVFRQAMRELGYVEGKNIAYERRFTQGENEPLPKLATELVDLKADVIVAFGTPATRAAQQATRTVPIVMAYTGDPVGSRLIASLARPGGNTTGVANLSVEVNAKRVDLLVTTIPKLSRVAALLNHSNPTYPAHVAELQAASQKAKVTLLVFRASTLAEIEGAFPAMRQQHAEGLIVHIDSLFDTYARQIAELATRMRLPVVGHRKIVEFGGLMSYEPNRPVIFVRAATYVDKILKGANPAEMPVEQPTRFDLTVNLKAAKALGVSVPREVLLLADEVIR